MADNVYPDTLPSTANVLTFVPAERRLTFGRPARFRPFEEAFRATTKVEFQFTGEQAAVFRAWWEDDLELGLKWFTASWPNVHGFSEMDYRFRINSVEWRYIGFEYLNVIGECSVREVQAVSSALTRPHVRQTNPGGALQATVSWTAVGSATEYFVYRDGVKVGGSPGTAITGTSFGDGVVLAEVSYCYTISALVGGVETAQTAGTAVHFEIGYYRPSEGTSASGFVDYGDDAQASCMAFWNARGVPIGYGPNFPTDYGGFCFAADALGNALNVTPAIGSSRIVQDGIC